MKIVIVCCMLFSTLGMHAQLVGTWNTGNDDTKIKIIEVNGIYEGKIASSDNAKAPIGKSLLKEIQLVDGEWKGKLFAAKKGEWMDAVLEEKGNQLLITVKAGLMSKTIKWTKE